MIIRRIFIECQEKRTRGGHRDALAAPVVHCYIQSIVVTYIFLQVQNLLFSVWPFFCTQSKEKKIKVKYKLSLQGAGHSTKSSSGYIV